jgi:hypothetical protein
MGSTVRTTTVPTNALDTTNDAAGYATPLRASFVTGQRIAASHFQAMATFVNLATSHQHTLQEYGRIADYGNSGTTNGPYTQTTGVAASNIGLSGAVTTGGVISAADHNAMANGANSVNTHSHSFTDTVN